ncbi:MAG: magnesium transporter [candidate division WOR-3 bacterium]|nr:MAG: magnesium transporter [candidate division WOR-3 bacterium]
MPKARKKRRVNRRIVADILLQATPVVILTSIGELFAGSILGKMHERLDLIPGLIILVPAVMGLRGNIGTALGSRMSASLHLGLVSSRFTFNRFNLGNIEAGLLLSLMVSVIIGMFARLACQIFGLPSIPLVNMVLIAIMASAMASLLLVPFTVTLTFFAFNKRLDPDNIVAPVIGMVGDVITVAVVFIAADVVSRLEIGNAWILLLLPVIAMAARRVPVRYRLLSILKQSIPILIICTMLGVLAGIYLHWQYEKFYLIPGLLILVPQIIAKAGSIGGIFGARFSSALHLGYLKPYRVNDYVVKNFLGGIALAMVIAPIVAMITKFGADLFGIPIVPFVPLLLMNIFAIVAITFIIFILDFLTASLSYKVRIDPSNAVIPLVTSLGDIVGTVILVLAIGIFL